MTRDALADRHDRCAIAGCLIAVGLAIAVLFAARFVLLSLSSRDAASAPAPAADRELAAGVAEIFRAYREGSR